jgi:pilus assembly protein CpaF
VIDDEVVRRVRRRVSERLGERDQADEAAGRTRLGPEAQRVLGRQLVQEELDAHITGRFAEGLEPLSESEEDDLIQAVVDALFGMGPVEMYLADESIENIHAQGCDRVRLVRSDGTREWGQPLAASDAELVEILRTAAARTGRSERRFDAGHPVLNLRLPDGSRLFAAMEVTARPVVSIRRHRFRKITLADLVGLGTLDAGQAAFFDAAVRARCNIVVGGGTDVGKTTFLRALINSIDPAERLVVVEDESELNLAAAPELHPDVVEFEKREANVEGEGLIDMAALTRMALRMAPDRVLVGEIRGGDGEVLPMLLAMSQGNDGSMCTIHADSSAGVLSKISLYAVMTRESLPMEATAVLIANSVHFVVHLAKLPDGTRVVSSVREVVGADGPMVVSNEVFEPGPDRRARPASPMTHTMATRLRDAGLGDDTSSPLTDRWTS